MGFYDTAKGIGSGLMEGAQEMGDLLTDALGGLLGALVSKGAGVAVGATNLVSSSLSGGAAGATPMSGSFTPNAPSRRGDSPDGPAQGQAIEAPSLEASLGTMTPPSTPILATVREKNQGQGLG